MDDQNLVQRLLQGDPEAQAEFDRTYRPRLYRSCCHLLGYKDSDVEDVVQDTFLAAYQQLPTFEFRSSLHRWLIQIAMFKCFRVIRGRRKQVTVLAEEMEILALGESLDRQAKTDEKIRREALLKVVRRERDTLGETCRELLKRREEEGQTYGQLAEALKIPVGTVMSRLSRCMNALRKRLEKRLKAGPA